MKKEKNKNQVFMREKIWIYFNDICFWESQSSLFYMSHDSRLCKTESGEDRK